jgi:hypothetical protein
MKPPITGIVVLSLAAGLVRAAGPPLSARDLHLTMGSMTAPFLPAAASGSGLVTALTTLETALKRP